MTWLHGCVVLLLWQQVARDEVSELARMTREVESQWPPEAEPADELLARFADQYDQLEAALTDPSSEFVTAYLRGLLHAAWVLTRSPAEVLMEEDRRWLDEVGAKLADTLLQRVPAGKERLHAEFLRDHDRYREALALLDRALAQYFPDPEQDTAAAASLVFEQLRILRLQRRFADHEQRSRRLEACVDRLKGRAEVAAKGTSEAAARREAAYAEQLLLVERVNYLVVSGRPEQAGRVLGRLRQHLDAEPSEERELLYWDALITYRLAAADRQGAIQAFEAMPRKLQASYQEQHGAVREYLEALSALNLATQRKDALPPYQDRLAAALLQRLPAATQAAGMTTLADSLLESGELDAAATWLERSERPLRLLRWSTEDFGDEAFGGEQMVHDALAACLALARNAPEEVLETHRRTLQQGFEQQLMEIARLPLAEEGSGLLFEARRLTLLGALVQLDARHGAVGLEAAADRLLRLLRCHVLARSVDADECTVRDLRAEYLQAGHGMVILIPAPNTSGGCQVLAFDRESIRIAAIGGVFDFNARQKRFLEAVQPFRDGGDPLPSERRLREYHQVAAAVGAATFPEPIRELLATWRHLTLVNFDCYGPFAVEALEVPGVGTLGLEKAIDRCPSPPFALHQLRTAPWSSFLSRTDLLLVAAPEHSAAARTAHPALETLPISSTQIDAIRRHFVRGRAEVLAGRGASQRALLGRPEEACEILALLAHGVSERDQPGFVLFGEDDGDTGIVSGAALSALPANRLAFFGICEASAAAVRRFDMSLHDLGAASLVRGSQAVVTTPWSVPSRGTTLLLDHFLAGVVAGQSPATALQHARRHVVEAGHEHPMHHSLMQLVGIGHLPLDLPPAPEAPPGPWYWLPLLLAVPLVGWLLRRRRSSPEGNVPPSRDV